jgi:hypothetical protein
MHAALDINIPNYASAIGTAEELVTAIAANVSCEVGSSAIGTFPPTGRAFGRAPRLSTHELRRAAFTLARYHLHEPAEAPLCCATPLGLRPLEIAKDRRRR